MESLQLVALREVDVRPMPDPPDPGPGEVLVRIRAVGICGSDMHFYNEGGIAGKDAMYPMVLGHEPGAEIAGVGPGVEGLKTGTKVAVEPAVLRKECEFSLRGQRNLCEHIEFLGGLDAPGALREYAVVPAENCVVMPDSMTFADAAFIEPLAVLLHSLELAELTFGESVAVMGAGPIGLLAVQVAKLAGASRILVADRVPYRLKKALELGADEAVDITKDSAADAARDLNPHGVHVVFDAAGKPESINSAIDCLRPGGRLVLIGVPSQPLVGLALWEALNKELTIRVQKRSNGNDHDALAMMKRGLIRSDSIMTHSMPLSEGHKAFEMMANYADGVIKPVVEL